MTKQETGGFLKKIKSYYQVFKSDDKDILEEWYNRLKDYDLADVERKFEEHLKGDKAENPPMLHFLTRYLKTKEEKERATTDYEIYCNMCGQLMYLSDYDSKHYDKCLLIKSLISLLKENGRDVTYEELDEYDFITLEKIWNKYYTKPKINSKEDLESLFKDE